MTRGRHVNRSQAAVFLAVFWLKEHFGRVGFQSKSPENCGFRMALREGHQIGICRGRNTLSAASGAGAAYIRVSRLGRFRQPVGSPRNFDGHDVACHWSSP